MNENVTYQLNQDETFEKKADITSLTCLIAQQPQFFCPRNDRKQHQKCQYPEKHLIGNNAPEVVLYKFKRLCY